MEDRDRNALAEETVAAGAAHDWDKASMMPILRRLLAQNPGATDEMRRRILEGRPLVVKGHVIPCEWLEEALGDNHQQVTPSLASGSCSSTAASSSSSGLQMAVVCAEPAASIDREPTACLAEPGEYGEEACDRSLCHF